MNHLKKKNTHKKGKKDGLCENVKKIIIIEGVIPKKMSVWGRYIYTHLNKHAIEFDFIFYIIMCMKLIKRPHLRNYYCEILLCYIIIKI